MSGAWADERLLDHVRALGLLTAAVDRLPRPVERARLATVEVRGRRLTRQPAVAALLLPDIEAVSVDGVPVGSRQVRGLTTWRPRRQTSLPIGPRTLDGVPVDPLLAATDGIEHRTVRADVLALARLAHALVRPADVAAEHVARLLTGYGGRIDPRRHAARAIRALEVLSMLFVRPAGVWLPVALCQPLDTRGQRWIVGPRPWTREEGPRAWRLTGGLFRDPRLLGARLTMPRRALDGIESALTWSPPRQRQRTPRRLLPDSGRTVRGGGLTDQVWQIRMNL